jgi:3-hydroxymyristoyl/3-hydroxydecanoyl-(acyl carrier protein) dehydratase
MRWDFVDRIESYQEWKTLTARKAVSFEEFHLLENQGRQGEFPESLLLETCVETLRWLIIRSSGFQWSAALHSVDDFLLHAPARCGDVLSITAAIDECAPAYISAFCAASCSRGLLAGGKIQLETIPLEACFSRSWIQATWKELHGKA